MSEMVNHPSHYNIPGKKECIEEMREIYGDYITAIFCLTSAYKYLYRAGLKPDNSQKQDLDKAKWYYDYQLKLNYTWEDNKFSVLLLEVRKGLKCYGYEI